MIAVFIIRGGVPIAETYPLTGANQTPPGRPNTTRRRQVRAVDRRRAIGTFKTSTSSRDPDQPRESAAPAPARSPRHPSRGSAAGSPRFSHDRHFTNLRGGHAYADLVLSSEKTPLRVYPADGTHDNRGIGRGEAYYDAGLFSCRTNRLMHALSTRGLRPDYTWGIGRTARACGR